MMPRLMRGTVHLPALMDSELDHSSQWPSLHMRDIFTEAPEQIVSLENYRKEKMRSATLHNPPLMIEFSLVLAKLNNNAVNSAHNA